MFEDRLRFPEKEPDHKLTRQRLPSVLVTMPVEMDFVPFDGMVVKVQSPTQDIWKIVGSHRTGLLTIAKLLGTLILDEHEVIMHAHMMPSKYGSNAVLLKNGEIRQGRGMKLAQWVLREIDRLARILLERHRDYLAEVQDALQGGIKNFIPFPDGFILLDQTRTCRLGPPPPPIEVDLSGSEKERHKLEWYQIIAEDYRRNRFMAHLSDDQLAQRVEDILANEFIINFEGLVSLDLNATSLYWFARFQEVITEMALRHGPYPSGWHQGFINRNRLPGSLNPLQLEKRLQLKPKNPPPQSFIVKYGKIKHIEDAYNMGLIRVAPASSYNDPSLNAAVKDDELTARIDFDPTFSGMYENSDFSKETNKRIRLLMQQKSRTDYYVYCTAEELSTRLLLDFEADVALIIHDPNTFLNRLDQAMRKQLHDWSPILKRVKYYDPLQITPTEINVLTSKHFRYAYQKEIRVAWLPPRPIQMLEPISLDIGCLSDIAELLYPEKEDKKYPDMVNS
jgi:hypothetical protein